jgi:hypothetical protein
MDKNEGHGDPVLIRRIQEDVHSIGVRKRQHQRTSDVLGVIQPKVPSSAPIQGKAAVAQLG